jgi:TonB family protein
VEATAYYSPLGMRLPRGVRIAALLSAVAHIVLFSAVWALNRPKARVQLPSERVITTHLVRLGEKPRPKNLLPRLPTVAPPAAPAAVPTQPGAAPKDKSKEQADEQHDRSLSDRIARMQRMDQALTRVGKHPDNEGSPDGSPNGKVSSFTEAVIGNRYITAVKDAIMRNFTVPSIIDQQECRTLKAVALIKVAADGTIVDKSIIATSGNKIFDDALMQAIVRTHMLPPPPEEIRDRMRNDGAELHAPCKTGG